MKRQFEYNGYKFIIEIKLNYKAERRLNGNHWHLIKCYHLGNTNYSVEQEVMIDHSLVDEKYILAGHATQMEEAAKLWADKRDNISDIERYLINHGFTKA